MKFRIVLLVSVLAFSGCGSAGPSQEAIDSCVKLKRNLLDIAFGFPPLLHAETNERINLDIDNWETSMSLLGGQATRDDAKRKILAAFPFNREDFESLRYSSGVLPNKVKLALLKAALPGTGFSLELTEAEQQSLKGDFDDPSAALIERELSRIIGDEWADEPAGCAVVDKYLADEAEKKDEEPPTDSVGSAWTGADHALRKARDVIAVVAICERDGRLYDYPCEKHDYVSDGKPITFDPPKIVNPWTRTFRSKQFELVAKTSWCINEGYRDYSEAKDRCVN